MPHLNLRYIALGTAAAWLVVGAMANDAMAQPAPHGHDLWRRTADGWERSDLWEPGGARECAAVAPLPQRTFHPALLSALIAIAAIAALLLEKKRPTSYHGAERRRPHWRRHTDCTPTSLVQ